MKANKLCSEDMILNELFKRCDDILLPLLHGLFKKMIDSGSFPHSSSRSCIVHLFKENDVNDLNNYRGISLVSCFEKLFNSIINNRMLELVNSNSIAQYGFRGGLFTVDATFALQAIIKRSLDSKNSLYCSFADFIKVFNSIDRTRLWKKLVYISVTGKCLRILNSLYSSVKSCVKYHERFSVYFLNNITRRGLITNFIFYVY